MVRQSLEGRVVWITGASSGIGALTARKLAEKGAIPVLTARSADKLSDVSASIRSEHAAFPLDVTDPEAVSAAAERVWERFGRMDILLNNAGYGEFVPFDEATLSHFQNMMDVNYMGAVRCVKAALPYMRKAGGGHIVNVASIAGKLGTAKSTAYTASKHALLGFTSALRQELSGEGIAVSAVNPGPIDTPFFQRADPGGTYVSNVRWFMMKPEKVANAIISVMESRRAEKDLPLLGSAGARIVQLFPGWTSGIVARLTNKK
ncbi:MULTISPECIES: SDR family NAD(P)-dependent oxidoreductase [Cohnella]|uniref:SDR family NAD(P)-dependent oxidoreductase n=1 Tax=Cohnella TaxID=329857 RepID=UPI0009B96978|nr:MULTISPECIES: SDR family NAD(P)-dependent oxidoreductase [Cohnella]MBN2982904.1 SDR family NAD(P)-dependent oxidoreductase [Cohnella algarum]